MTAKTILLDRIRHDRIVRIDSMTEMIASLIPGSSLHVLPEVDGVDGSRSRHLGANVWSPSGNHEQMGAIRMEITTIGLDLAKNVFQIHCVDGSGQVVLRKALRRGQVLPFFAKVQSCLVGMEACGTAHHWARELLKLGHDVRMMPPAYVKPYVKRGNTDAADAEAICEAVTRPTMRFVAVKSLDQQAALSMHRARELLVRQRTQIVNMMRGLLGEFGIHMPVGIERILILARQIVESEAAPDVPPACLKVLHTLSLQALDLHTSLQSIERDIVVWQRTDHIANLLMTIPGVGPIGATAFASSVGNPHQFKSGREFAAWLGLTPRQNSSGGKERLGKITKMGDRYLRRLLVLGMTALVRRAKYRPDRADPRHVELLARKPMRLATVAMANKTARIIWAVMSREEPYRSDHTPALGM